MAEVEVASFVVDGEVGFLEEDAANHVLAAICCSSDREVIEGVCEDGKPGLEVEGIVWEGDGRDVPAGEFGADGEVEDWVLLLEFGEVLGLDDVAVGLFVVLEAEGGFEGVADGFGKPEVCDGGVYWGEERLCG